MINGLQHVQPGSKVKPKLVPMPVRMARAAKSPPLSRVRPLHKVPQKPSADVAKPHQP